ncbi:MAG TPA: hypothetical protein VGI91_04100 [Steroidobacteraceae bacterium]
MNFGPRRGVALLAAIVLHVGLVAVAVLALRSRDLGTPDVISLTYLDLPPQTPELRLPPGQPPFAPQRSTAITLPPMPQDEVDGAVDFQAEARNAAAEATRPGRARPLDSNPATQAVPAPGSPDIAVHHAGEQYRDADGTSIVFVSDHCFIASAPAPPGTADVIARAMPTRLVCKGDPGWSRPDLFKDLPAYRRYHGGEPGQR